MNNIEDNKFENIKANDNDELSLLLIFKTLKRNKKLIIIFTSFLSSISIIYGSIVQPKWIGSFNIVVRDDCFEWR